jgi:hypothetical protein
MSFRSVGTITVLQAASTLPIVAAANNVLIRTIAPDVEVIEPSTGWHQPAPMHVFRSE